MDNINSETNQPTYIDLSYLREISGNDQSFIIEMIETYIENIPLYIEEMKTLLADQKWNRIGALAHKMKPSIGFMGIHQLKNTIQQLQVYGREVENISEIPSLIEEIERVNEFAIEELNEKLNNEFR